MSDYFKVNQVYHAFLRRKHYDQGIIIFIVISMDERMMKVEILHNKKGGLEWIDYENVESAYPRYNNGQEAYNNKSRCCQCNK